MTRIAFDNQLIDIEHMLGFLTRLLLLAVVLAPSWYGSSAHAQSTDFNTAAIQYRSKADSQIERAKWKRTRARIGVSFSVLALPISAGFLAAGVIFGVSDRNPTSDVDDIGSPRKAKIFLSTGSIVLAGGLVGLGVSARGLRVAKRELDRLESKAPLTMLQFGPAGVALRHRF